MLLTSGALLLRTLQHLRKIASEAAHVRNAALPLQGLDKRLAFVNAQLDAIRAIPESSMPPRRRFGCGSITRWRRSNLIAGQSEDRNSAGFSSGAGISCRFSNQYAWRPGRPSQWPVRAGAELAIR